MSEHVQQTISPDDESAMRQNFDPADPGFHANPSLYYRALLADPPAQVEMGTLSTVVSRYADALSVLRDPKQFSSVIPLQPGTERFHMFGDVKNPLWTDPPEHTRFRRLTASSFAPRKMTALEPRVRAMVEKLLDRIAGRREIDLAAEFSKRLPLYFITDLLDVPESDFDVLVPLVEFSFVMNQLKPGAPLPSDFLEYGAKIRSYFGKLMDQRRRRPGEDLISNAVAAHDVEAKISDDELFSLVMVTVLGAVPTTADMISATVYNLLANPAQLEAVRANPALAAGAVEEALRYDPPVHTTIRFSAEDCEIGGVRIAPRSPVYVVMGAANRDPAQFPDPDRFDITRDPNDHLSFGDGIHICIGAASARIQGRLALKMLLERFPRLRLADPHWRPIFKGSSMARGLTKLPVSLD
jgi:pimeloyl-[acyl-carrier protein] synthase